MCLNDLGGSISEELLCFKININQHTFAVFSKYPLCALVLSRKFCAASNRAPADIHVAAAWRRM